VGQSLSCVKELRDYFLIPDNYKHCKSLLVERFGELLRKIWNDGAFKGQVSPHELFQAISVESNRKYRSDAHSDPAEFLNWFLNSLHRGLGGTKQPGSSIVHKVFQGKVKMESKKATIKKVASPLAAPRRVPVASAETRRLLSPGGRHADGGGRPVGGLVAPLPAPLRRAPRHAALRRLRRAQHHPAGPAPPRPPPCRPSPAASAPGHI